MTFIIALFLGVFVGVSVAIWATAKMIVKSNDIGNAKGDFDDFTRHPLRILEQRDKIRRPNF